MNNNIIKGLIAICLLLLLMLLIEWQIGKPEDLGAVVPIKSAEKQDLLIELPKLKLAEQTVESYSHMVSSPLFIQGRKTITEALEEEATESVGKVDDLTLLGIYSVKDKQYALFSKKGKDKTYLKKLEGEEVSGWQIIEIKPDRVVVEQQGKQETLLLRKPKPKTNKRVRPKPKAPRKKDKT